MKRVFRANIIYDTRDDRALAYSIPDLIERLNKISGIEAINPHMYPEDPIVLVVQNINPTP